MWKVKPVLCLGVTLLVCASSPAADNPLEGTYLLSYYSGATQNNLMLIKFESKEGKPAGTVLSANPRYTGLGIGRVSVDGNKLRLDITTGGGHVFEGSMGK